MVQRALILWNGEQITTADLIIETLDEFVIAPTAPENAELNIDALGNELKQQENQIILDTLVLCHGSRKDVADKLGISPRTLRYKLAKMRDLGIELPV